MRTRIYSEAEARASETCVGCGKVTNCPGGLCCWHCYKYRTDVEPLKYCGVSFEDWQRLLPELPWWREAVYESDQRS